MLGDVDDLAEENQMMDDTSIHVLRVVDLHVEVDPAVCPGYMMQHESAGDNMGRPENTVRSASPQRHAELYDEIQRGIVPCREETHLAEYADVTHSQQHIVVGDHLHRFSSCMGDGRWRVVYQQLEELLLVVPDDWSLVMTTGENLSWIPMDELLVESLGFIGAGGIFHLYSQPQISLLSFSDTFIIDNSMRRIADDHRGLLSVISLTQE
jgi:hypothetical protein